MWNHKSESIIKFYLQANQKDLCNFEIKLNQFNLTRASFITRILKEFLSGKLDFLFEKKVVENEGKKDKGKEIMIEHDNFFIKAIIYEK